MRTARKTHVAWLACSLLLLVLPRTAAPQSLSNIPGAFSEVGFGVRPAGMGQAFTAIANDANAFLTNPAGLLLGRRATFSANYAKLFGLIPSSYVGLLYPMNPHYAVGAGFLYVGDDALGEYTLGVSVAYSPPNLPVGASEIYFDQMSFGLTLKGRWATFGNNPTGGENRVTGSGSGFSIDLGYFLYVNENLTLGVMVRDLFNNFTWNSSVRGSYSEGVPATLRFGAAYNLEGLLVAFDLRKSLHDDTSNRAYVGAELTLFEVVQLRGGFSTNLGEVAQNRRWSFGLTFLQKVAENYSLGINTAYRVSDIENLFRFGLDVSWGKPTTRPKGRVR